MPEDYYAKPLKNASIAEIAYAWRDALGVDKSILAVPIVHLVENVLPLINGAFALVVERSSALDQVEAYTEFSPPKIVVRENVYWAASEGDPRARWTFAHELGHLVLHDTAVPVARAPLNYRSMEKLPAYASSERQADKFAASFLAPRWIAANFKSAVALSLACGISRQAAEIRLQCL